MKNNFISRVLSGVSIIVLSALFIFFVGFRDNDYFAVISGIMFIILALFIIFNKKEDDIEEIKNKK